MERNSLINWGDYFYYDENSPTGLRWKHNKYTGKTGKTLVVAKDKPAGHKTSNKNGTRKCIDVRLNRKLYKVHRIVWEIFYGKIPDKYVIDHLDQNPWNNKIENLEPKPKEKNHRNTKLFTNNTSGVAGVYWQTMNRGKHTYAVARVQVDSREYSARFGTHHFGLLSAFKMAVEWRIAKIEELNNSINAGFTSKHGEKKLCTQAPTTTSTTTSFPV